MVHAPGVAFADGWRQALGAGPPAPRPDHGRRQQQQQQQQQEMILSTRQEGVRPAAARLALGVEMEGWKLNRACGLCSLALEPGPVQYQLARDSVVGRALRAGKPNLNMKFFE